MSGDTLKLLPDSGSVGGGTYKFYAGQVVGLTATLTKGSGLDVQNGARIVFSKIASARQSIQNPTFEFVVYPAGQDCIADEEDGSVSVPLTRTGYGQGEAQLTVWLGGATGGPFQVSAQTWSGDVKSDPLVFEAVLPLVFSTIGQSGCFLPLSQTDTVPSDGNFIYSSISVLDPDSGAPLPNMRVRIAGDADPVEAWWVTQLLLYASYDAADSSDALSIYKDSALGYGGDLQTDESGSVELFVCAKHGTPALGGLQCLVGPVEPPILTVFIVANVPGGGSGTVGPPPIPDQGEPVKLDGQTETFKVRIQKYQGVNKNDRVYLFCNGEYQCELFVDDAEAEPLGYLYPGCYGLRSLDYDEVQPANNLAFIVSQADLAIYSIKHSFLAQGQLPPAQPPQSTCNAAAPYVVGNEVGLPLNCDRVSRGVRLRVPFRDLDVSIGDTIFLSGYLNAYRQDPYGDQPRGAVIQSPLGWRITPKMLRLGYADWWISSRSFMGFGQQRNGDLGTFQAQYRIFESPLGTSPVDSIADATPLYCSEILSLPLDTIPPAGWDDGIEDKGTEVALCDS